MAQPDNMNFDGLRELPEQPDSLDSAALLRCRYISHRDFHGVRILALAR